MGWGLTGLRLNVGDLCNHHGLMRFQRCEALSPDFGKKHLKVKSSSPGPTSWPRPSVWLQDAPLKLTHSCISLKAFCKSPVSSLEFPLLLCSQNYKTLSISWQPPEQEQSALELRWLSMVNCKGKGRIGPSPCTEDKPPAGHRRRLCGKTLVSTASACPHLIN